MNSFGKARRAFLCLLLLYPVIVSALPELIEPIGEKAIVVDPREHRWGAYTADGRLIKTGVASAGKDWCDDMQAPCYTHVGQFRIRSLGGPGCTSPSFPLPYGGAPMPYCMYFTYAQALHGSNEVADANLSHGCVRLHVSDARWIRYNFAQVGTLVIIESY